MSFYAFRSNPSLVHVLGKLLPSLEETTNPERRGLLTFACHILSVGTVTLPFRVVMLIPSSFLVALVLMLLLVYSLKGDSPSLHQDLSMYLKIGGIWPAKAATGLATCSIGEVVFPYLFLSHVVAWAHHVVLLEEHSFLHLFP